LAHRYRVGTQAVLPLNPTVLTTVLQHVDNGALRRQAFVLSQRHSPRALKLLDALLLKRDELAKVLEFPSYAALSLANRMAKKPATVHHFLDDLSRLVKGKADKVHTLRHSSLFAPPPSHSLFVLC
jgi:Zn-dependent oligopeptidase